MNVCFVDTSETDLGSGLSANGMCVGRVVGVTAAGEALVEYPGNLEGPRRARSVVALDISEAAGTEPLPVLLFLDSRDSHAPIILASFEIRSVSQRPRKARVFRGRDERSSWTAKRSWSTPPRRSSFAAEQALWS